MTLRLAILTVLDTCPRPITAEIVLSFLPGFYDQLKGTREQKLNEVINGLEELQAIDQVKLIPNAHFGRLWSITPSGKAAL